MLTVLVLQQGKSPRPDIHSRQALTNVSLARLMAGIVEATNVIVSSSGDNDLHAMFLMDRTISKTSLSFPPMTQQNLKLYPRKRTKLIHLRVVTITPLGLRLKL
jgi:hypothetical protein